MNQQGAAGDGAPPRNTQGAQVNEFLCEQIHEHLRETQRKRDQTVAFYVALLAGLFAGWNELEVRRAGALLGAFVIGVVSLWILLRYRHWHIRYLNAATVFQHLRARGGDYDLQQLEQLWGSLNDRSTRLKLACSGTEAAIYFGLAAVVGIVAHLLIAECGYGVPVLGGSDGAACLVNVSVVLLAALLAAMTVLPNAQAFEESDWMFRWRREPPPAAVGGPIEGHVPPPAAAQHEP